MLLNVGVRVRSTGRWIHENGEPTNCYEGNMWDSSICPDVATCGANCALEGADEEYKDTYGVDAQGDSLDLQFVTSGPYSKNVGSRTYLMDDENKCAKSPFAKDILGCPRSASLIPRIEHSHSCRTVSSLSPCPFPLPIAYLPRSPHPKSPFSFRSYYMFKLKNKEFSFDVDVSNLPCGLNGALYFVQMDQDGGKSKYSGNMAGAKYGTGYCDAQCPHDLKFIDGEPNMLNWHPSATDPNAGTGKYGSCCVEMDIWEANSISSAYTAHSCAANKQTRCEGIDCGDNPDHRFDGLCDKNGCDFQTYRLGNTTFYGPGSSFELDTTKPMSVVTQFLTADGTDTGKLTEIRRFYKQGSKQIDTPSIIVGRKAYDSLSTDYCKAEKNLMDDGTNFLEKGGFDSMDDAAEKGMVLVMSIWDDHDVNMLWLDSVYPPTGGPGSQRGTCSNTSGVPSVVEKEHPDAHVTFSNIRFGPIGSTSATAIKRAATPLVESATRAAAPWAQCTAASGCRTGWECTQHATDASFKQCTPSAALHEAFLKTNPDAAALKAFMDKGTTHFTSSGLPQ